MINIFLKLLLAHFLGDFVFQPNRWVKGKEEKGLKSRFFWFHMGIHLLLMLLLTGFTIDLLPLVMGIGVSHAAIDFLKIKTKNRFSNIPLFFVDQALHLLVVGLAVGLYFDIQWSYFLQIQNQWLVIVLALVLLTYVAGVVMQVFLSKWDLINFEGDALHKAGWYIGVLERLFIFGFVMIDYWAGIGFLIAAKSIFRFSDLTRSKDRKLTEYVLIGTLLSYGIALLIAVISLKIWTFMN